MTRSSLISNRWSNPSVLLQTLQLKVDFKSRGLLRYFGSQEGNSERGLGPCYASADNFLGRTAAWTSAICDSLLRANRAASSRATNEWAKALRFHCALSAGNHSTCAPARLYVD